MKRGALAKRKKRVLSRRTSLSICQFLALQEVGFLNVLLEKHGIQPDLRRLHVDEDLLRTFGDATEEKQFSILDEIIRTQLDLRARTFPKYRHDERWQDLLHCLALDGYRLDEKRLIPVDPTIDGAAAVDDDLSDGLRKSGLPEADNVIGLMEKSADAFRTVPPDYNGSLVNTRIALETLAEAIAKARLEKYPDSFDATRWGQVLAYLRKSGLLSKNQEEGIAGVYSLVSAGAHEHIGLTEEEMVRLGRSLVASACYFLIKLYNGNK